MRDWLLAGDFTGQDAYQARALAEAEDALAGLHVETRHGVAVVVGDHRLGMSIGYRYAPVVIATNPTFSFRGGPAHRKHTIARWNTGAVAMDWVGMLAELRVAEPGWGGSASIVGSPMGAASELATEQVAEFVIRYQGPYPARLVCPECAATNGPDLGELTSPATSMYRCSRGHVFAHNEER
jgi:hypothetical protein